MSLNDNILQIIFFAILKIQRERDRNFKQHKRQQIFKVFNTHKLQVRMYPWFIIYGKCLENYEKLKETVNSKPDHRL